MDMNNKNDVETRRMVFAVAIFFGVSAANGHCAASHTETIYSLGQKTVDMEFFNGGEFTSDYNFNRTLINAGKSGASYWKNIIGMRSTQSPWQIAFTTSNRQIVTGKTFSLHDAEFVQDNYLLQMLKGDRDLEAFDLKSLADKSVSAEHVQQFLQENAPLDSAAVSVIQIGNNVGANRSGAVNGWSVDEKTILPTNEQAADLIAALRLELAHALGAEALIDTTSPIKFPEDLKDWNSWTFHLTDKNGTLAEPGREIVTVNPSKDAENFFVADKKIYFTGKNVTEVLLDTNFDGVRGIPINAWNGSTFDGVQTLIPGLMSCLPYKNYTTFTELELAAMQDIGYDFDRKKLFGHSIYSSGNVTTNATDYVSGEPLAVGLHVWGVNNFVTQSGDIYLTGDGSAGIRVDGFENQILIPQGTEIRSNGQRGKGVLISYGRDQNLDVAGNVAASGNAVEFNFGSNILGAAGEYRGSYIRYLRGFDSAGNIFTARNLPLAMTEGTFSYAADELNGALVKEFNLTGTLSGGEHAIYIGKNSFVKDINVNDGAQIFGDITSDWRHFTAEDGFTSGGVISPIRIQYGNDLIDATKYIPDLTTNLNFNTSIDYGGNISGADNLKMHVNAGRLNFFGAADVVSVDVMRGAELFGGTFTLNDMSANIADGFTDATTGKFINHGIIGASSPDTNLVINGDLISDGFLKKISGGSAGSIIVNGAANVEGSTVTTDSLLPNETATLLTAESITGNITNPKGRPLPLSSMLNVTGEIVGNTLTVTTHEANNFSYLNPQEEKTFDAMNKMFDNLEVEGHEIQREEMRELYNLEPPEAKKTLSQIGSNDAAQIMSVAQQSNVVDKMISGRVTKIFAPDYVDVNVHPLKLADGDDDSPEVKVKVKVPSRQENNFWLNYMKNWGKLRGGTDYHGSVIVGGYDRPFGRKWRAGIFATYGTIGYGADSSRATVYDTRLGLYAGYHNRASDVYLYINGGQLRNSLHRGISSLGLSTNANYKSRIVEIGGEYKYDLQPKRIWHISPFVNFQASYLKQNSYNERGAGIYNQHVDSNSNTYFAAQAGLDLKRYYRTGMFGMRIGVKHGFTGADPDLQIRYEGDALNSYRIRHKRDKTHFVFSLRGENEFARGWFLGGEAELQLGENDKDVTASVMLRRMW